MASIEANINIIRNTFQLLQRMISEGIAKGYVRPLSKVTYAPSDVSKAFRLLANSGHCGRVLMDLKELSTITATPTYVQNIL